MTARLCWECDGPLPALYPSFRRFCCSKCAKRNRRRRDHKASRARSAGSAKVETLDPFDVFERDGWRCVLCRTPTPKSLIGSRAPDEPTLDHVRPLKFRGHHTMANVRLACRRCNEKRDQVMKHRAAPARMRRSRGLHGRRW